MLRSCTTVDKCTNADSQCVKDCCHLEGETPIEIRIAYQQPRHHQAAHLNAIAGQLGPSFGAASGAYPAMGAGVYDRAYYDERIAWAAVRARGPGDAEKPALPRGAERLRLPPPPTSNRSHGKDSTGSKASDEFDPDTFAAPPDSGRDGQAAFSNRTPGAILQHVYNFPAEDDFFPEVVRISREGSGHTPRHNDVPWTPASHRSNRSVDELQAVVRGVLFPQEQFAAQPREGDTAAGESAGRPFAGSPDRQGRAITPIAEDHVASCNAAGSPGIVNGAGHDVMSR